MNVTTQTKNFSDLTDGKHVLPKPWGLVAIVNDDNLTYLAHHAEAREAVVIDPMREDWDVLVSETRKLSGYRFIAVIDTHTHADHVSCAAELAKELGVSLVMSGKAPCSRVTLRVDHDTALPSMASPLQLLVTPGHTSDSITPIWGPFVFGGDTLMHGDTGRDDLPGGNPEAHFDSLQKIKSAVLPSQFMLPGHDGSGGRVTSWQEQLELNPSLTQEREIFVREASAYVGPRPKNLEESLFENSK